MYCKQCGKEIPDGSAFCATCGAPVSTGEHSAQPGAAAPSAGMTGASAESYGEQPGAASPSDANGSDAHAPEQAARQATPAAEKKKRFCTRCGREIPDGATFCTACGAPVSGGASGALQEVAAPSQQAYSAPAAQLKTDRSILKYILLSLVTFGIYGIVMMTSVANDINTIASRYDDKRTMHYCLLTFLVAPITLGIGAFVWSHKISARIGAELQRRGIDYKFGASDYWLWGVLGIFIIVGPFVYFNKLFTAMNLLSEDYNRMGC